VIERETEREPEKREKRERGGEGARRERREGEKSARAPSERETERDGAWGDRGRNGVR